MITSMEFVAFHSVRVIKNLGYNKNKNRYHAYGKIV